MTNHPNAEVAAAVGGTTVILVWLVGVAGSLDVPAEVSSAFTTVLTVVILALGKRSRRNRRNRG